MKELPILFSGPMVRAILEGRKTQTRRVIKLPLTTWRSDAVWCSDWKESAFADRLPGGRGYLHVRWTDGHDYGFQTIDSKYIDTDQLWVRETWKIQSFMDGEPIRIRFKADGSEMDDRYGELDGNGYCDWYEKICEQSTDELIKMNWPDKDEQGYYRWDGKESPLRWRPSIYMPRWCSRLSLIVKDIRAERLQDISELDAISEGFDNKEDFIAYWDILNFTKGHGWITNP